MRSTATVVLIGPASPADVADLLTGRDAVSAASIEGYRGVPVSDLARAFVRTGTTVEVVTTAEEVEEATVLEGRGFRILVAPRRSRARARARDLFRAERTEMCRLLHDTTGEVLHAHWTYEFAAAGQEDGRPLLITAHDAPLTILRHSRDLYRVVRTAMAYSVRPRITHLSAVSPYLADQWRRQMLYRQPISVVPNIAPSLRPVRTAPEPAKPIVVDVAAGGRLKNVEFLVRAFARVRETTRAELWLVGPGLGRDGELAASSAASGLDRDVQFVGAIGRDEIAHLLSRATVFAHSSKEEACPLSILEAMRAGVPVVAGRGTGGTPWLLDDGRAGVLADLGDVEAFAGAITRVLGDAALRTSLRDAAARRVATIFSERAVTDAYRRQYDAIRRDTARVARRSAA